MKPKLLLVCLVVFLLPRSGSGQSTLQSRTYNFEDLTAQKEANATFRPILDGLTHNGVHIHVHEVFLLPGSSPHHAHHHQQEEMFLISEGEVEVTIVDKITKLGPGSVSCDPARSSGLRAGEAGLGSALDAFGCDFRQEPEAGDTRAGIVANDDVFGDVIGVANGVSDES